MKQIDSRIRIKAVHNGGDAIQIHWQDGHVSRFHHVWLRHQCHCDDCGTPVTALRNIYLYDIPDDIELEITEYTEDGLDVRWKNDGHASRYNAAWLRDHCYSEEERRHRRHKPILWDRRIRDHIPICNMEEAEADATARFEMLKKLRDYGFCRIRNAPRDASEKERLIRLVGPQRQTHFGTYNLGKKNKVSNVGDTTGRLVPHVDETYRLSTVGITVFQVLQPAPWGGDSSLVDGFEAVRRLQEKHPEDFDLLTRLPITAVRRDSGQNNETGARWYEASMPVIRTDYYGNVTGVRLNERQIAPLDVPADLVRPCYRALRRLFDLLYSEDLSITFHLRAGEGLIFNNQRLLHGRTAFTREAPARAVLTSSVDIEEFHSTLRLLQEEIEGVASPMQFTQGMVV